MLWYFDKIQGSIQDLNRILLTRTNHTGSDVKISTGEVLNPKAAVRQSIEEAWWQWEHVFRVRWQVQQHINILELRSITFGRQVPHFQFEKVSCSDISCHGQLYLHVGGSKGTQWQQTAQQGSATVKCTPVGIWYIYILLSHTLNLVRTPLTMPAVKWQFVQRRSKAERARDRGRLVLWDASITKKTQERYYSGLQKLLPVLVKVTTFLALDEKICDWIQRAWDEGECQHVVGDALCGLHHYEAWTKSHIPNSWKLFKVWRRLEHPKPSTTTSATRCWKLGPCIPSAIVILISCTLNVRILRATADRRAPSA